MATTGYDDRIFWVEVSGLRQQPVLSTSHCTFKVSYRSLARTLQFVRRNGGTIVRIHALTFPEEALSARAATLDNSEAGAIAAQPSPTEAHSEPSSPTENTTSTLKASAVTQPSVVAEPEDGAPPLMSAAKPSEPSKLSKLISFFLNKRP